MCGHSSLAVPQSLLTDYNFLFFFFFLFAPFFDLLHLLDPVTGYWLWFCLGDTGMFMYMNSVCIFCVRV